MEGAVGHLLGSLYAFQSCAYTIFKNVFSRRTRKCYAVITYYITCWWFGHTSRDVVHSLKTYPSQEYDGNIYEMLWIPLEKLLLLHTCCVNLISCPKDSTIWFTKANVFILTEWRQLLNVYDDIRGTYCDSHFKGAADLGGFRPI